MTNPASVTRQLVGTFSNETAAMMSDVFSHLGARKVCIVHAEDGLDEISLGAKTHCIEVNGAKPHTTYKIDSEAFSLPAVASTSVRGG